MDKDRIDYFEKNTKDIFLDSFHYKSLHAPVVGIIYRRDDETREILKKIEAWHRLFEFDCIVIHPNGVEDWLVFKEFDLPFAVENMDNRNDKWRQPEDFEELFLEYNFKMVLDVNHCFTNDNSLKLVDEFYKKWKDRIVEIHLSGFEIFHDLLFKTKQEEILNSVPNVSLPIIVESHVKNLEEIKLEYSYIKKFYDN